MKMPCTASGNGTRAVALSVVFHLVLAALIVCASAGFGPLLSRGEKEETINVSWVTLPTGSDLAKTPVSVERKAGNARLAEQLDAKELPVVVAENNAVVHKAKEEKVSVAALTGVTVVEGDSAARSGFAAAGGIIERAAVNASSGGATGKPLDTPRYCSGGQPYYPEVARRRGYEGTVLVAAEVNTDGKVARLFIRRTSGHTVLDRSALDSVRNWRFNPGRLMGKPVAMWVDVPVHFLLEEKDIVS